MPSCSDRQLSIALTYPDLTLFPVRMSNIHMLGSADSPVGWELTQRKLWQQAYN